MEDKKVKAGSVAVGICLFIIAILLVVIVLFFYNSNKEKNKLQEQISELETIVEEKDKQVNELENKISKVQNVISEDDERENTESEKEEYIEIINKLSEDDIFFVTNANKNSNNTYTLKGVLYTKFTLTKSELEEAVKSGSYNYMDINYTVEKNYKESNSDVQYDYAFIGKFNDEDRLEYVAIKKDDNTYYIENTTENNIEWKLTNNYRKITVSGNIEVENRYEEVLKVNDYFNNYEDTKALENDSHPSNSYTFEFLNGNCSKIYERVTGY